VDAVEASTAEILIEEDF
jgi:transposase